MQSISSTVLPPHPAGVAGTGNETEDCGTKVHPARCHIPGRFRGDENVAGDQTCSVGDRDEHGTCEGAGVEIGDVGHDPCIVDG